MPKELVAQNHVTVSLPCLDAGALLKIRPICDIGFSAVSEEFARQIDQRAMRSRGIAWVLAFSKVERELVPITLGSVLDVATSIRLCDAALTGGDGPRRLGLEVQVRLTGAIGTSDPLRVRETRPDAERRVVAKATFVLAMVRMGSAGAKSFADEVPAEVGHLTIHPPSVPVPSVQALVEVGGGYVGCAGGLSSAQIAWGAHHTDVNQHVYAAEYFAALEDAFARAVGAADRSVPRYRVACAELAFKRPFVAGTTASIKAFLHGRERHVLLVGRLFAVGPDGQVESRESVVGRLTGSEEETEA